MTSKKSELNVAGSVTPTVEAPHISKTAKEQAKELLQKFMKEESRLVKGVFHNYESPGGALPLKGLRKYPPPEKGGVPGFSGILEDGREYEVPLWVARWLNGIDATASAVNGKINSCAYPVHGHSMHGNEWTTKASEPGEIATPLIKIMKWKRRFAFQSLEFAGGVQ